MVEIEIGVLMRHGLPTRVPDYDTLCALCKAWEDERSARGGVDWQFTNTDARIELKHLYPKIMTLLTTSFLRVCTPNKHPTPVGTRQNLIE
jgi:hypothetical protein